MKTKLDKQKLRKEIRAYIMIVIGLLIADFGWVAFVIQAHILGGGITGVATLIYYLINFPVGYSVLIFNSILVIMGIKILGPRFGINSVFGIIVLSLGLILMQKYITQPIISDRFLSAILGGALSGLGTAIAIMNGGNGGGLDIIALIITKYKNISPGKVNLYFNLFVISSSYFIANDWETVVYSFVVMGITSYMMDLALEGSRQSYQVTIFSEKSSYIADKLITDLGRGVTVFNGIGWFSKKEIKMLFVIIHKNDLTDLHKLILSIDKEAFVSEAKVTNVFGKNFSQIRA